MPSDTSVYPRKGRPFWFVSYFCTRRLKRVHESTPWRVDDPIGHKHALSYASDKSKEAKTFRRYGKEEIWDAWVDAFLAERYGTQAHTFVKYKNAWNWLRLFLREHNLPHPNLITYAVIVKYVDWRTKIKRRNGKFVRKNTALVDVIIFGVIIQEAIRREYRNSANPCFRTGFKHEAPAEKPEITDKQVSSIYNRLAELEGNLPITKRWMTISFTIGLYHGLRIAETALPMDSFNFEEGTVRIVSKGWNGVKRVRTVRIHPKLLPLVLELRDAGATSTLVFPFPDGPNGAAFKWHDFFKGENAPDETKNLCFHCTRVTVVTRLARAGVPEQQAMRYVGHASNLVHRIYQRLRAEDLNLCADALNYPSHPSLFGGIGEQLQIPGVQRSIA